MSDAVKATTVPPLVTKLQVPPGLEVSAFSQLMINLMMAGIDSPGSWSAEIIAPNHPDSHDWLLVQRHHTAAQTATWKQSPARSQIIDELNKLTGGKGVKVVDDAPDLVGQNSVATAITTEIKQGMQEAYRNWEAKVQAAQANSPGYRGAFMQPPVSKSQEQWTTIVRFDTPENLEKWFACEERQKLLPEVSAFVKNTAIQSLTNSFPGWVPSDPSGKEPANWQTCLLVLLGLFPIVMLEIKFLAPLLSFLNPGVANFLSLSISVFGVSYGTMPHFINLFKWWLFPADDAPASNMVKGLAMIAAIAVAEMALFWNLLL